MNTASKFECQAINPSRFRVLNELQPIYPLSSGQVMSGYDYLLKLRSPLKKRYHNKKSSQRE